MPIEWLIGLAVIYFVLNRIAKFGRGLQAAQRQAEELRSGATGRSGTPHPQAEGFSLAKILQDIEKLKVQAEHGGEEDSLELRLPRRPVPQPASRSQKQTKKPAQRPPLRPSEAGPIGRMARAQLPAAEEVEDRRTLEGESLEGSGRIEFFEERGERQRLDQDDAAEEIVQRRIAEAEARNRSHSKAEHQTFDQKIRETPADNTAVRGYTAKQIRDAVVWREILGEPKGLRTED